METPYIRVTSRTYTAAGNTTEQIIELGEPPRRFAILGPAELHSLKANLTGKDSTAGPGDVAEDMAPGDKQDMVDALAAVSADLGCPNNLDDMLHAIDGLRAAAPTKLEWSHTLTDKCVDHATAEKACAALGEGWRLPTRAELESILDLTRNNPAADPERFPDMKSDWYWSSTPCAWSSAHAWCVGIGYGGVNYSHRVNDVAFARAVRAVPAGQ